MPFNSSPLIMTRLFVFCTALLASTSLAADAVFPETTLKRVAFGSCFRPAVNPEIFDVIRAQEPNVFLFLGDNVYADTEDMTKMRADYDRLRSGEAYQRLGAEIPVLATWDDHDYGLNDAGVEFPAKDGAKVEFLRAFEIPETHPMRKRGGVYHSALFGPEKQRVQILLLDTRWFRSPLKVEGTGRSKSYVPEQDPAATVLGEEQWSWLEAQLKEPAALRIIGSSIQVLSEEHRFEKWANFPRERERLLKLLADSGPVVLLSGDRHMGEIAKLGNVVDITSSGLTNAGSGNLNEKNQHRIGSAVGKRNFGLLTIDWSDTKPAVLGQILGEDGSELARIEVK